MTAPEGTAMTDIETTLAVEPEATRGVVIRHVLERQLGASQILGAQLVGASTDVSVALVHAPATVVDEIRGGATLPAALAHTRTEVRGVIAGSLQRAAEEIRGAVTDYDECLEAFSDEG
jgi:hypothetical protein